jgi:ABC-type branched-subunit amino acid transport system ATPase component
VAVAAQRTESAEPILRLRGVGRRFGGLQAVDSVDLEIRAGERRAILGPNGAGKTTLFNVIAGEFPPTSGTIELFGNDVTETPARLRARLGSAGREHVRAQFSWDRIVARWEECYAAAMSG